MSEYDNLPQITKAAQKFAIYYSKLAEEQGLIDEWKVGRDIANKWLDHLNNGTGSRDIANELVGRAFELQKSSGSGAIDMYYWIARWRKWLENNSIIG